MKSGSVVKGCFQRRNTAQILSVPLEGSSRSAPLLKSPLHNSESEDSTFRSKLPSSVEALTEPPIELEKSFREEMDVGRDAGGVVCLLRRNIREKLKSICSVSRLYVVSWEEAGETASSTRDVGRALSTESGTGVREIFDGTWQDGSEEAGQFWQDEGRPDSFKVTRSVMKPADPFIQRSYRLFHK